MATLPAVAEKAERDLPDYLPARMVNEFVYCPRLFFYEWVDGVFRESVDTMEGKFQHRRVDSKTSELPKPEELGRGENPVALGDAFERHAPGDRQDRPGGRCGGPGHPG